MKILILGAGFGGLTLASELEPLAKAKKAEVTLVDKSKSFSMGFSMQWVLDGRRKPEEGERKYSALKAKDVTFISDDVVSIDASAKKINLKKNSMEYDVLVLALGAELAPELVPGLSEGYNLCDFDSVLRMKKAIWSIERGTVAIVVSSTPFKCPAMPYEYAFLIDSILRKRGIREKVRIVVTTPEPQPMPVAGKVVGEQITAMLAEKGIEYLIQHKPKSVEKGKITYDNGFELAFDILGAVPPHRAPKAVRESGLADASGFVPAELGTFKTAVPGVFAIGDVASLKLPDGRPHPKAGIFAEAQAKTLAKIIASEMTEYTGSGTCYIDTGNGEAAAGDITLLSPQGVKAVLSKPSAQGLEEKGKFERERFLKWFE